MTNNVDLEVDQDCTDERDNAPMKGLVNGSIIGLVVWLILWGLWELVTWTF
jgi:uncharacterized membrane protein